MKSNKASKPATSRLPLNHVRQVDNSNSDPAITTFPSNRIYQFDNTYSIVSPLSNPTASQNGDKHPPPQAKERRLAAHPRRPSCPENAIYHIPESPPSKKTKVRPADYQSPPYPPVSASTSLCAPLIWLAFLSILGQFVMRCPNPPQKAQPLTPST